MSRIDMKNYGLILILFLLVLTQTSCTVTSSASDATRGEVYAKMYEEKPVSILVMPPINNTNNVEAKDLLYTSISRNIAEAGYYVISPVIAMDVFKNESAYDAEYFFDAPLGKFNEYFGADAVVFAVIEKWAKEGIQIHTIIRYVIKSTTTNVTLYERSCDLTLNLMKNSGNSGILGALTDALITAIDVAMTDHIEAARYANYYIFDDLPRGKYNPMYLQDSDIKAKAPHVIKVLYR